MAQPMLHDPSNAGHVDLDALEWNGEAMRAEGRLMARHGLVMAAQAEQMISRHGLQGQAATDLRTAAATLGLFGGQLEVNGKEMVDYAQQLRKSLGDD
jgi:hypothetical protein